MKRILVPVDFSSHTGISCKYACHIAQASGAEIILFHSFFDQLYFSDGGFTTGFESGIMLTDEIILDFYKQKESKLNKIAEELKSSLIQTDKSGVKVSCRMESGDPEVQIINVIDQRRPDLIVMGSGGMGKKRMLSGSVARRIIDNTDIPVIAVPHLEKAHPIINVIYMTTFDPADAELIPEIDLILSTSRVNIFCLHILRENTNAQAKEKIKNLAESQSLKKLEGRISYHILNDDQEEETLRNFINENKIDLIAFIPHKRNIFKNIFYQGLTRDDLFLTHIPIMAIKPIK